MGDEDDNFPTIPDLKRKPVFKEMVSESGHPEITIENLSGKIEDLGYKVSSYGSHITADEVAEGVKDFRENLEAERSEKHYRKNAKEFKKYAWISLGVSILFTILFFSSISSGLGAITLILWIATIILFVLSRADEKFDRIWIRTEAKVYSGTKAREIRDSGKHKAGTTKSATSVYVHSEIKFSIGADSEIGVDRVKEDVNNLSKYIQKI